MAYNDAQKLKYASSVAVASYQNANTDGAAVDCQNFNTALAVFRVAATTGNIDVLKLQESDNNSDWTDISGAAWTGSDLPGATDDNSTFAVLFDLRKRKRYIRWHFSEDNTGAALCHGFVILGTPEASPVVAADHGADFLIELL